MGHFALDMLKMYNKASNPKASSGEFWDENWAGQGIATLLADSDRICEGQPIYPILMQAARPDRLFLEGGCGPGYWVKYLHTRGYRVLGVDFGSRTIGTLLSLEPDLPVQVGDIASLPFADREVHTYYSGGVVEHFEGGPEAALLEAHRVLSRDGTFLCSVPDETPLRRLLYSFRDSNGLGAAGPHAAKKVIKASVEPSPAGYSFFQYAFSESEFTQILVDAGFSVSETLPFAFVWGLYAVPGFEALYGGLISTARYLNRLVAAPKPKAASSPGQSRPEVSARRPRTSLLRRLVLNEDPTIPVLSQAFRRVGTLSANMRMYVAHPR